MATLITKLTATPGSPPTYNVGMAETFSWIPIEGAGRPLFARANYITNFEDFTISLSAAELNIESITIKDGNSGRVADVEDAGNGFNALRVISQDLEPQHDTVSLGDREGNNVSVTTSTSSLNVHVTNELSATITSITPITIDNDSLNVNVLNPVSSVDIVGSVTISNPVTSIKLDQTTPIEVRYTNTSTDAFNRMRVSTPTTLFDSSHRYRDNELWATLTTVNGTHSFNANRGMIDMTVDSTAGSSVIRETLKVFSYQPGKGLLSMNTFVFAPSATNLRQRIGYFGQDNGYFLQLDDHSLSLVERTLVNGSPSTDTAIDRSQWNGDKLDGTGSSGIVLDITKSQIFWMDFEWLGVGTVRCGFMIDGKYIICHSFHHANIIASTYITTACLPIRYEITNKGTTTGSHTMKQSCSTVISEGGYELRGDTHHAEIPIDTPKDLPVANTYYPLISIRLKVSDPDAIAILSNLSLLGISNNSNYHWKLLGRSFTSGGTWVPADIHSSVEYNNSATSFTPGVVLASGFAVGSNQGSTVTNISKSDLFRYQLERDTLNGTFYEMVLIVAGTSSGADVFASLEWEEVTR